jgi:hypothetical protein
VNLFPPFEKWLERAKWGLLPDGLRPAFREGYRAALRDAAERLRVDGLVGGALHVEQGLARMNAEYPEPVYPPHPKGGENG